MVSGTKRDPKLNAKRRGMIKFSYFRNSSPKRDWLIESEEIPPYANRERHPYVTEVESYRDLAASPAHMELAMWVDTTQMSANGAKLFINARPLSEIVKK